MKVSIYTRRVTVEDAKKDAIEMLSSASSVTVKSLR